MIRVEQLSKTFRVHRKAAGLAGSVKALFKRDWLVKSALKDVSLSVSAGEIVGLLGANGAGKTTLTKTLAGIIHPSSGTASVLGYTPWKRADGFRRQISLIMGQKAQLWWDLPAADCFLLLREIYRIPKGVYQSSLAYLAETLNVTAQLNIQIRRLSLGERMKMELIAALLHSPQVVFLDEPTIGLDLTAQKAIRDFILAYRSSHQPAMLLTSHYMEDIERLCERIIILREGEVVYDGSLARVTRDFATHKIVIARLRPAEGLPSGPSRLLPGVPESAATVLELDASTLKVRAHRSAVPSVAAAVLQHFPVIDLTIEEPDVGSIIEALQRTGRDYADEKA